MIGICNVLFDTSVGKAWDINYEELVHSRTVPNPVRTIRHLYKHSRKQSGLEARKEIYRGDELAMPFLCIWIDMWNFVLLYLQNGLSDDRKNETKKCIGADLTMYFMCWN